MSKSSIEWTQATWNPIVGCSIVSPGCTNCYAMKMAARIEGMNAEAYASGRKPTAPQYDGTTKNVNGNNVWTGKLSLAGESTLLEPLRRRKPTTYFVNSMSDLFLAPWEWIDQAFCVMAQTPHHTYQILTKRGKEMREYCSRFGNVVTIADDKISEMKIVPGGIVKVWPLPNVWLGVSTERQKEADERIPHLLATPAAVRFISAEPLLGPIDLTRLAFKKTCECKQHSPTLDALEATVFCAGCCEGAERLDFGKLDWVIVGGESGPGSRPMHPDWARSLRDQCLAAGVPFFFKQWGNWFPLIDRDAIDPDWRRNYGIVNSQPDKYQILNFAGGTGFHGERVHLMQRLGKKDSGRVLDGLVHDEMPAAFTGRRSIADQLEGVAP
jgi:protein gp37